MKLANRFFIRLLKTTDVQMIATVFLAININNLAHAEPKDAQMGPQLVYQKTNTSPKTDTKLNNLIHITSGTGFFVSNDTIVTNEHVVQDCRHIKIRGAVAPGDAIVSVIDKNHDLALLKTASIPKLVASLRGNMPVRIGEPVNVMGYPLGRGIKGSYLIKKAIVTNDHDVYEGVERIQFTDTVEKGNSGGPLLDTNGTVVGVIVGKMNFYLAGTNAPNAKPIKTTSVAIPLNNLKKFLNKNNVFYNTDNTLENFADSYMENKAKDYIVNIQCIKDEYDDTKGASAQKPQNPAQG